ALRTLRIITLLLRWATLAAWARCAAGLLFLIIESSSAAIEVGVGVERLRLVRTCRFLRLITARRTSFTMLWSLVVAASWSPIAVAALAREFVLRCNCVIALCGLN